MKCRLSLYHGTILTVRSYTEGLGECIIVFPFHRCCLEILTRFITKSTDTDALNKGALYHALFEVTGKQSIDFDYGVRGQEQYWDCLPGEEVNPRCHSSYMGHGI